MFAKLLKHEWRSTREMLGILCLIALGASLLGGLTMSYLFRTGAQGGGNRTFDILSVLFMVAAMIAMAIVGVAAVVVYIGRFYKSRFTDEGYLTFTLPVNTHQNLLASLVNTTVGMILMTLVICVSGCLWMAIAFMGVEDFYPTLLEHFPELWTYFWSTAQTHAGEIPWGLLGRLALNVLTGSLCQLVMLMLAVTIGSILARKHKILTAVGVYYGIQVLTSVVTAFLMSAAAALSGDAVAIVSGFFGRTALLNAALGVGGYFLMYWLVDRKLNLN